MDTRSSSLDQNWKYIQQSAREFYLDVHAVSGNFLGDKGWQWLKEDKEQEDSRWERFKFEMMDGARFYSNFSKPGDRIFLGLGATVYTPFYFGFRFFVYDAFQNSTQYFTYRTGKFPKLFDYSQRETNSYVLGAAVSAPFITGMFVTEAGLRIMGGSRYGRQIIKNAGVQAINLTTRYTGLHIDEKRVPPLNLLSPKTLWDCFDRLSLMTIPGAIAGVELGLAGVVFSTGKTLETTGRIAGLTNYGFHRWKYASMVAVNKMQRYTGFSFSNKELKEEKAKLVTTHSIDKIALGPSALAIGENLAALIAFAGIRGYNFEALLKYEDPGIPKNLSDEEISLIAREHLHVMYYLANTNKEDDKYIARTIEMYFGGFIREYQNKIKFTEKSDIEKFSPMVGFAIITKT